MLGKNIIGVRIRKARKEAKMTQMELATQLQLLGVRIDRSAVAKVERGLRPINDIEIAAISKVLDIPIQWLFQDSGEHLKS